VIDAADKLRVKVARNELENLLDHPSIPSLLLICVGIKKRSVPILFFANKMDLGIAMTEQEVAREM
jgi:hypothetical protein